MRCLNTGFLHGLTGREGGGGGSPPPVFWANKASRAIFAATVGQYWLIIKINGTNSVHFWEILSILWEICYLKGIFRNHSSPPPVRQQFWKVSPENFLTTRFVKFFDNFLTIRKSSFRPLNFFLPVRPWLSAIVLLEHYPHLRVLHHQHAFFDHFFDHFSIHFFKVVNDLRYSAFHRFQNPFTKR
jgi:hypothetical protein